MKQSAAKIVQYTLATHAVEGMKPSAHALQLCRQQAAKKITANAAVKLLEKKYGIQSVTHRE